MATSPKLPAASEAQSGSPETGVPQFEPVPLRARHDGWTPKKQVAFIEALTQCGCIDEACGRVGMHRSSAYELRERAGARNFRAAWDAALDRAVRRLEDACFSRAINGVTRPVFFKGEQIGERTYFDERLAMFLLRYRNPERYGRWRDHVRVDVPADGTADYLRQLVGHVESDAECEQHGMPNVPWTVPQPQVLSPRD